MYIKYNVPSAMLGEQFMVGEEICGAVVSIRFAVNPHWLLFFHHLFYSQCFSSKKITNAGGYHICLESNGEWSSDNQSNPRHFEARPQLTAKYDFGVQKPHRFSQVWNGGSPFQMTWTSLLIFSSFPRLFLHPSTFSSGIIPVFGIPTSLSDKWDTCFTYSFEHWI